MNAAAILALCACALQLGMGLLLLGLARAPGWRAARTYAVLALTAAAYSGANVFYAVPAFSDQAIINASRVNYLMASLHVSAWMMYTFGGPTASLRKLPVALKWLVGGMVATGVFIFFTALHIKSGPWHDNSIAWAGVSYHTPRAREWAEWYGALTVASLIIPFIAFIERARRRVQGAVAHLIGFTIFFVCITVEVGVANDAFNTFYLADIGFLSVVIPVAAATVRRVVADAGRLNALSQKLAGEVEARTEALDRAQVALLESERHAALGRLAAGVGHEINNPLTYLGLSLEAVDGWAASTRMPNDVREALENARDGTNRIRQVVDGLRNYTRTSSGENLVLRPDDLVRSALKVAAHQLRHSTQIITSLNATASVLGDEARLVQVVVNLLTNAAQAINEAGSPGGVSITICTRNAGDKAVAIEVIDTGPGISPANLRLLAQPYFTTRANSGGTGLGLFLARGIIEQHGGRFEIESEIGNGTTARVILPAVIVTGEVPAIVADEAKRVAVAPGPHVRHTRVITPQAFAAPDAVKSAIASFQANTANRQARVIVIDDEPLLARVMARVLGSECEVEIANSADDALVRFDQGYEPDAIICDLMMPGMSGIEFADVMAMRNPALRKRTLFMTGGAVTAQATSFLERDDVKYLNKPVGSRELLEALKLIMADSTTVMGAKPLN